MAENMIGRPPVFKNADELEKKALEYFEHVKAEGEPVTITGLCLFLGFESRQSFYDYGERDEFSYIIKKLRLRVEMSYEIKLSGSTPTGPIFVLKNMGWTDRQEIAQTVTNKESPTATWSFIDASKPKPKK